MSHTHTHRLKKKKNEISSYRYEQCIDYFVLCWLKDECLRLIFLEWFQREHDPPSTRLPFKSDRKQIGNIRIITSRLHDRCRWFIYLKHEILQSYWNIYDGFGSEVVLLDLSSRGSNSCSSRLHFSRGFVDWSMGFFNPPLLFKLGRFSLQNRNAFTDEMKEAKEENIFRLFVQLTRTIQPNFSVSLGTWTADNFSLNISKGGQSNEEIRDTP